ncbi:TIM barrel protein [Spirosoma aureum]|uniref:TIM barrel protein n=1 Tax=Spirosoma aureum TaxID=2692134 RepID=A0A6G9AI78_9BACT|nr:sugar phosphate isomerase/epimerase family protein [Spirosoma aureum]QIP12177.1 TIM barrel protein [Spirosoma aureum]
MRTEQAHFISRRQFIGSVATAGLVLPSLDFAATEPLPPMAGKGSTICIFSKHLHWLSIPEMAETAATLGFSGIDLTVRKGGHVAPERVVDDLPKAVSVIRTAGLDVPMITTDVISPDDPLTEPILKTATRLGIPNYRTAYLNYDRALGVAQSLDRYKEQLQKLAALNQKYGIHGAYQNHAGTRVGAAVWDLWELIKDIDPRWLGCQYDIKHAVAEGGMSWINGLDVLKAHIRCIDIKDFIWVKKADKWHDQVVPLGEGMVDFKAYFALLKQYSFSGPMSIHYEFPLGGADTGQRQLTMPRETVLAAIKHDLQTLRGFLKAAQLD